MSGSCSLFGSKKWQVAGKSVMYIIQILNLGLGSNIGHLQSSLKFI